MPSKNPGARPRSTWLLKALILFTVVLIYGRSIDFPLIGFDDALLLKSKNSLVQQPNALSKIFTTDVFNGDAEGVSTGLYRPIFSLSLLLDKYLGKDSLRFYHGMNIVYHLLACLLLFQLFTFLGFNSATNFTLTFLFALHPLGVMTVAWIPGRNDLLLAITVIAGFLFFLRSVKENKRSDFLIHLLFVTLALFTKENAIVLPLACIVWFVIIERKDKQKRDLIKYGLAYLVLIGGWSFARYLAIGQIWTGKENIFSVLTENLAYPFMHLTHFLVPINLTGLTFGSDIQPLLLIPALLICAVIIYFGIKNDSRIVFFGGFWFLAFIIPTLLTPAPEAGALEHRAYLPGMGILLALSQVPLFNDLGRKKITNILAAISLLLFFLATSVQHLAHFNGAIPFWENFTQKNQNSGRGWITLGNYYEIIKNDQLTTYAYQKAVESGDLTVSARLVLGEYQLKQGLSSKAQNTIEGHLKLFPNDAKAWNNLGLALQQQKRYDEAKVAFEKCLELNSMEINVHNNLAVQYAAQKNYTNAETELKLEISHHPDNADAYFNLGLIYRDLGKENLMDSMFRKTLEVDPEHSNAKKALALVPRK